MTNIESQVCKVTGCDVAKTGKCMIFEEVSEAFSNPNNEYTPYGVALTKEEIAKRLQSGCAKCEESITELDNLTPVNVVRSKPQIDDIEEKVI